MANKKLFTAINSQITHELGAEMQYLAMSFWFERENLHGMASWFKRQAVEELQHAMKIVGFMNEWDLPITLKSPPDPVTEFASPEALKKWMPVDFYLGGEEHVNGHLLYSRFFTKILFDAGYIDFDEPFKVNRHQGLILGSDSRKMSKRWGNVINPTDVIDEYGADTLRIYEMFMGPLEQTKPWNDNGVKGVRRFLERTWRLREKIGGESTEEAKRQLHKTIKKVKEDCANLQFNTAVAAMMELVNAYTKEDTMSKEDFALFVLILSPFAPHMANELWEMLGNSDLDAQAWPAHDESLLVADTIEIVVQVNGKVRAKLTVDPNISKEDIEKLALEQENVQKFLEGKAPKKIIYVPGKLVSVVV